jgi:hypothetical protein
MHILGLLKFAEFWDGTSSILRKLMNENDKKDKKRILIFEVYGV